ncbi:MAG: hypothetical protein M3Y64_09845, partial [Gemmatimonadota bacterium]|nr:hypothetical protein [Gemmatimonadota bacterium]
MTASADDVARARARLEADRRQVAALTLFARRMSHDLSNYVTVVRTYSELLSADLPDDGTARADVLEIHRAADAMVHYLQRVNRFARPAIARPGTVAIDEALIEIVDRHEALGRIEVALASKAVICIDGSDLADAVSELLKNAFEATPVDEAIQLR